MHFRDSQRIRFIADNEVDHDSIINLSRSHVQRQPYISGERCRVAIQNGNEVGPGKHWKDRTRRGINGLRIWDSKACTPTLERTSMMHVEGRLRELIARRAKARDRDKRSCRALR